MHRLRDTLLRLLENPVLWVIELLLLTLFFEYLLFSSTKA